MLNTFLYSLSFLFFIRSRLVGVVIFILLLLNPFSAFLALISFVSSMGTAKLIGLNKEQWQTGFYAYNSILVGILMGSLYDWSFITITYALLASNFCLLVSFALTQMLYYNLGLPLLNLSFTVFGTLLYLASFGYSNLLQSNLQTLNFLNIQTLPLFISGFLKALGTLLFLPFDWVGIIIVAIIAYKSRIFLLLSISSYYVGSAVLWLLKGSANQAFSEFSSFNFILIGMALGGYFLIPSRYSYFFALLSVAFSVLLLDATSSFWTNFGIPVFTFPFLGSVFLALYILKNLKSKHLTELFLATPELNLEHFHTYKKRFSSSEALIQLPVLGTWNVYQGFDDIWTHKGAWKHAIDLVITHPSSKTSYVNKGESLKDYFCFSKPVVSPVWGTVHSIETSLPDNPIGEVDKVNNWGNHILIYVSTGYFVLLCHLQKDSIEVAVGQQVVLGQILAKCGNSGYSPEPHLHFHVQNTAQLGSHTIPFKVGPLVRNNDSVNFAAEELNRSDSIEPITPSRKFDFSSQLILDHQLKYEITTKSNTQKTEKKTEYNIYVKLSETGLYYFTDDAGSAHLYFNKIGGIWTFFNYEGSVESPLRQLYLALPRQPLTDKKVHWKDHLNPALIKQDFKYSTLLKSLFPGTFQAFGFYQKEKDSLTIKGRIFSQGIGPQKHPQIKTEITWGEDQGWKDIKIHQAKQFTHWVLKESNSTPRI